MNMRKYLPIFALEAVLCVFLAVAKLSSADLFVAIMAFPFEQIGQGLRWLSLSGTTGNVVAIILYVAICLAPCAGLLFTIRKRKLLLEDGLLVLLSILLFLVLYQMINPGLLTSMPDETFITIAKAISGTTVYSVICAYIVLRILRGFFASQTERLQKYMVTLLFVVSAVFVYMIFGAGVSELIRSIEVLRSANIGNEHLLGVSYVFLSLKFIVDSIPIVMNIAVVFNGVSLMRALASNRYSAETVAATDKLSKMCRRALVVTVLSNAIFNALQFVFAAKLHSVNSMVQIPLFSILFVLAVLILSRFASEDKELKDDNDSII